MADAANEAGAESKVRRGRPPKDPQNRKKAFKIYLTEDEIYKIGSITYKYGITQSEAIALLIKAYADVVSLEDAALAAGYAQVEDNFAAAMVTRRIKRQKNMQDINKNKSIAKKNTQSSVLRRKLTYYQNLADKELSAQKKAQYQEKARVLYTKLQELAK